MKSFQSTKEKKKKDTAIGQQSNCIILTHFAGDGAI
jgi:hypothetical protein